MKIIILLIIFTVSLGLSNSGVKKLYAPHKEGDTFFNPWGKRQSYSITSLIRKAFSSNDSYTEEEKNYLPEVLPNAVERIRNIPKNKDFILWIGHSTFLMRLNGSFILTDPHLSKYFLYIVRKRKTELALTAQDVNELTKELTVLLTHSHYDHLDLGTIDKLRPKSKLIVPLGTKEYIENHDDSKIITEMDWWETLTLKNGMKVTFLPAQHWGQRITVGENKLLWGSFLITTPSRKIFFSGDSGYFHGFKEFGKKFKNIDYALLPAGGYEPSWFMKYDHLNLEESLQAFKDLKAKHYIPTHWGVFALGDEPVGYPGLFFKRKIDNNELDGNTHHVMKLGGILILD